MDGLVRTSRIEDTPAGALLGRGERPSGTGRADGSFIGTSSSKERDGGLRFDVPVNPGGYAWWYVDALSEDGQYGLTIIAFIGSVFSPYYAWSGRKDPLDHCAVNVALYGPRQHHWAMTERKRQSVTRDEHSLSIGPSSLHWDGSALNIELNEMCVPFGQRLRGTVRLEPSGINTQIFPLDVHGHHIWQPIAPSARVSVVFTAPDVRWTGDGYFDTNKGAESLESGFDFWTWSRAKRKQDSVILYDADRREGGRLSLALRCDASGHCEPLEPPPLAPLPKTLWRVARETRSDDGSARVERGFEDTPFYSRSLISGKLFGTQVMAMHESLSLSRFSNPLVRLMLPFRMPRW
jgi:carotenoid 1,2-hydratase